jgi:hypothetical protein
LVASAWLVALEFLLVTPAPFPSESSAKTSLAAKAAAVAPRSRRRDGLNMFCTESPPNEENC